MKKKLVIFGVRIIVAFKAKNRIKQVEKNHCFWSYCAITEGTTLERAKRFQLMDGESSRRGYGHIIYNSFGMLVNG